MHTLFKRKHPDLQVTYAFYANYFKNTFSLRFGRPQVDTCITCEELLVKIKSPTLGPAAKLAAEAEMAVHKRRAKKFHNKISAVKEICSSRDDVAALTFDYMQNLPLPNIPIQEIFYLRQLWVNCFGIKNPKTNESIFYVYHEGLANKGANEVCSMILHYLDHFLDKNIKELYLFSDNCPGQNKNHTVIRFLLSLTDTNRFSKITHYFPVRGHSFLPNDQDFGVLKKRINKCDRIYVPEEYYTIMSEANPKFSVFMLSTHEVMEFSKWWPNYYKKTCLSNECFGKNVPKEHKKSFSPSSYMSFQYDQNKKGVVFTQDFIDGLNRHTFNLARNKAVRISLPDNQAYPMGRGWYILRDWNEEDFSGMKVLTNLQVRYGVSPYFKIHVEPDPHVPNTHSIRISPSGLGLPDRKYYYRDSEDRIITAYMDYIRDTVIYISSTRNEATKFGKDIFNYEKRIAEITPDLEKLRNPITTYNAISLAELKDTNLIPFHDILQAMYPEANISENTEVILTSPEYLSQISHIIASTDRQTVNGYLIWTLVRKYIPYLSTKFTSALDAFNTELYGTSKPKERWDLCSTLVKKHMELATEYLLEQTYPIAKSTRSMVNDTYREILDVVKNKMNKFDDTSLLTQHLVTKLNTLSLHIGLPESIKSPQFIKDYYKSLRILKTHFFESVQNAIVFKKKTEEKMLLNILPEGVLLKGIIKDAPTVRYIPSKNTIVVPRSLLMKPFFEDGFPTAIIYGRLGQEIANAIISSILPYGSLWTSDKKILSPFHMTVNESIKSVQAVTRCLSRYFLDLNLNVSAATANETALIVLTELSAIRIANEALQAIKGNEEHIHQGGLEQFEEAALYFLSYSQSQCSDSTSQYQVYESITKFKLSQKTILHLAWSQLSEFQEALDCTPNKKIQCDDIF